MSDNKSTQCALILDYLKRYGVIDDNIARREFGCKRLASRVCDLRAQGEPIVTVRQNAINRYGKVVAYAVYTYGGRGND